MITQEAVSIKHKHASQARHKIALLQVMLIQLPCWLLQDPIVHGGVECEKLKQVVLLVDQMYPAYPPPYAYISLTGEQYPVIPLNVHAVQVAPPLHAEQAFWASVAELGLMGDPVGLHQLH